MTIVGGICPRCGQFHDLFLAVDGSIVCRNADGTAERIRQLEAERDAARAEAAALQRILDQAHADRDAAIADAARMEMGLADLRAKVEGLAVRLTDDGVGTSLYLYVKRADVLAQIEEAGQ